MKSPKLFVLAASVGLSILCNAGYSFTSISGGTNDLNTVPLRPPTLQYYQNFKLNRPFLGNLFIGPKARLGFKRVTGQESIPLLNIGRSKKSIQETLHNASLNPTRAERMLVVSHPKPLIGKIYRAQGTSRVKQVTRTKELNL